MKRIHAIAALLLMLLLAMTLYASAQDAETADAEAVVELRPPVELADASAPLALGSKISDFTITTYDGQTITLSELLREKDAVVINIWASWCGPCRSEFPFMETAYKQYADNVEILALSCEPTDDNAKLADFAAQLKLTFPMAQDTVSMAQKLRASSIPTTVVVDRFGVICYWESGALPDADSFVRLFDAFVGEDYTESVVYSDLPPMKPNVAASSETEIAIALSPDCDSCGQTVPSSMATVKKVKNPSDKSVWPMVVTEADGHTVIASTNAGMHGSVSTVTATVSANAGDAVLVTFKTSTEAARDLLQISMNGEVVKVFSGEHKWMTYAIPVEKKGDCTIELSYIKNGSGNSGKDCVWIDTIAVATGDEAAAALAANPVAPAAQANRLTIANETAKEIVFDDENGLLAANFGDAKYYIVNDSTVTFNAELTAQVDPEAAFFYCYYNNKIVPLASCMTETGYTVTTGVDSLATTGYTYAYVLLALEQTGRDYLAAVYFMDETNVNLFASVNKLGDWAYAAEDAAAVAYAVRYVDQDGNPVPGVTLQVCDESTCQVYVSDENGVCTFTLAPFAWELHTLALPEGYEGDVQTVTTAPVEGGEVVFTLTRK